jgi:hypothetical protein
MRYQTVFGGNTNGHNELGDDIAAKLRNLKRDISELIVPDPRRSKKDIIKANCKLALFTRLEICVQRFQSTQQSYLMRTTIKIDD